MVWVDSGIVAVGADTISVRGFLIDRNEVTNARYLEFVAAGGYTDATLWDDTLVLDGTHLPWETAVSRLVDRTGLSGPRSWSGGGYSAGDDDHPVTGVSWYEAAAYARWKGKQLPSYEQWYRAALGDGNRYAPWGNDVVTTTWRANFNLMGVDPVGSYPLGVSPVGCFDMAGNVREWLVDLAPAGDRRLVVGGSWRDPAYMFEPSHMEPFDPWYAGNELGFRLATPLPSRQPDRRQR
jgi:formylglycine-generating enzyme required for sulfatase activity